MTAFTPAIRLTYPKRPLDVKVESVLRALRRRTHPRLYWRGYRFVPKAVLSAGLAPLFTLPRRFAVVSVIERNQFEALVDWMRLHTHEIDPARLLYAARAIGVGSLLPTLATVCAAAGAIIAAFYFSTVGIDVRSVFGFIFPISYWLNVPAVPRLVAGTLVAYQVALTIGFVLHWLTIDRHVATVRRFGRVMNEFDARDDIDPVRPPHRIFGLRPLWVAAGVAGAMGGAFWALPMMLAGACHARYTLIEGRVFRAELADRVAEIAALRRPVASVM